MKRSTIGWLFAVPVLMMGSAVAQDSESISAQPHSVAPVAGPARAGFCDGCYAHLKANGTVDRAVGVASATAFGNGGYEVIFNRSVKQCIFLATLGFSRFSGIPAPGFVTTVGRAGTTNGVFVQTYDINGVATNRAFHLLVECRPS